MIKKISKKLILPIIIVAIVILPMLVLGRDYGADYDEIFGGENGFTIHTNESISTGNGVNSDSQLSTLVQKFVGRYYTGNVYEGDKTYSYSAMTNSCSYENMTCDISVNKYTIENDMHTSGEVFKKYEDVKINIDNNVMDYFGTILNSNGDMIIKYDDSFFKDTTERDNYIERYVNSKSFSNSDGDYVSFSYDAGLGAITYDVNGQNFKDNFSARVLVNSIQFDKTETEFSENFKKLSSDGTLTIKTNGEITNYILDDYLMQQHVYTGGSSYSFDNDGEIVDNKVYIEMAQYGENGTKEYSEKHLITLVKDTNIDKDKFALINMRDEVVIPALEPSENVIDSYINRYFNSMTYRQVTVDDDTYYNFDKIYSWNSEDTDDYIRYAEYNNGQSGAVDVQYNKINISFSDYSDEYSSDYTAKFGNGVTVRSDEKTESAVSNNIGYSYSVLSCNEDVSVCDIALSHEEEKRVEIHKVNITFDNSVSDEFKRIFNLKEDGSIDIVSDLSLSDESYIHFFTYDEAVDMSLEYVRDGNKFALSMNPYSDGNYEKHTVSYNVVKSSPTAFYKNNVYLTKDFYPGESTNFWNNISNNYYFDKDNRTQPNANTISCDKNTSKCKVILVNSARNLEIHEVTANVIKGKSPAFEKAFPEDNVHINAIYKDDEMYLFGASMAYFMSKTKEWIYLNEFTENSAKVVYNDLEVHSFDVDYEKSNEKHAAAIAEAKKKLKDVKLSSVRKDLEFVNKFYYGGEYFLSSTNFNSKTLNDNFNKAVDNRHIGYYVVPEGGGGTYYENGAAGRLVLFYDGIAYDVLDEYVDFTNFNIVYIPTDTEKTPEAYVRAAQRRVDNYLGKDSGVIISYNGSVDEEFFDDNTFERYGINKNTFDYNDYKISYKGNSSRMLIVADSSKMQKPDFAASDVTENINVTSDTVNYPSNTVVMSEVIDKDESEYSKILDKAGIKKAHVVDINLYSSTVGDIDDFDGAEFNVSVPIEDEELQDKKLVAYYIDDKGNVEEHPVVMDDFMANFETTHFSTYIIAEKSGAGDLEDAAKDVIKNPNTGDNVLTYILLLVLSGTVVGISSYKFIKREN